MWKNQPSDVRLKTKYKHYTKINEAKVENNCGKPRNFWNVKN